MKNKAQPNIIIKYQWDPEKGGVDLKTLGESIVGFNSVIKETVKVLRIHGEVSVKASVVKDGSIIFEILTELSSIVSSIPFENLQSFLDFLELVGKQTVSDGFALASKAHEDLNSLYAKYPLDATLLGYGIVKLIAWAKRQKKVVTIQDDEGKFLPKNYAIRLHKLIKKRVFKKALIPFVEEEVSEIEIRAVYELRQPVIINNQNFEEYLSEEEQILPEYENGKVYRFVGSIVGLESSRGEYIKFKIDGIERKYSLLIAFPGNGKNTEDFLEFYKKQVLIEAEVMRKSFYQKPKLIIRSIDLMQKPLI